MPLKPSPLWNFFDKNPQELTAVCKFCDNVYSYKTTIANLKIHLKRKHPKAYDRLIEMQININADEDEDAEDMLKLPDVWSYFEQEPGRRARCVVCRSTFNSSYEDLKAHLKDNHPKLLLQIMQDKDDNSDEASNQDDNDNTYTEIVYLEQDSLQEDSHKELHKLKEKRKSVVKPQHIPKKRERLDSLVEEYAIKRKREDDNDELGAFIKYITCLLKKLPQDVFSKVQVDIISTILKASSNVTANINNSPRVILNSDAIDIQNTAGPSLITVNEITPTTSAILDTHNYTITVGHKEEEIIEKS